MFLSNTSFWDAQVERSSNLATMKVGWGHKSADSGFSVSTGVRIWPAHVLFCSLAFPTLGVLKRCPEECSAGLTGEGKIRMTWCVESGRCLWSVD